MVTDAAVDHLIYTVPSGGGPAIVRSVAISCQAVGAVAVLYIKDTGGNLIPIASAIGDGSSPNVNVIAFELYQVLEPTEELHAENQTFSGSLWSVAVGGYQFATP